MKVAINAVKSVFYSLKRDDKIRILALDAIVDIIEEVKPRHAINRTSVWL
jgi:hypothetical protein